MRIRLYHARILTMEDDREVFEGEVWVEDERITLVAPSLQAKQALEKKAGAKWDLEIDCEGDLLMPGFKDAHTHSAMTFLRSFADDLPLDEWLHQKIFPMEAKLTREDIYTFTKLAVLEYVSGGITSIFDMYIDPEAVAQACVDTGMRCTLVSGLNDFTSSPEQTAREYETLNHMHPLIRYQLGFHAEYTCSRDLLTALCDLAHRYQSPVYAHLSETEKEVAQCRERYGMTPIRFLDSLGMFDYGGGGYHCVHVSEEEMDIMERRGLYVVTNPASNLKLASGIAPIAAYEKRNIPVAIGTDGPASNNCLDMFREMFLVTGLSKVRERDAASVKAGRVLKMATVNGARAMGLTQADVLAEGKLADLIRIDLKQPNMQPLHHIPENIVYSASKANIRMTMVAGKILYRDGVFEIGTDPDALYQECGEILHRMLSGQGK